MNTTLPSGNHNVTVRAIDAHGLTGEASVSILVLPGAGIPAVTILSPDLANRVVGPGTPITFVGQALDQEDGVLVGPSLEWSSNVDGPLGTGTTITLPLSGPATVCNPELVTHTVTLKATDNDVHSISTTIQIFVGTVC
jgi:hypothetical protein